MASDILRDIEVIDNTCLRKDSEASPLDSSDTIDVSRDGQEGTRGKLAVRLLGPKAGSANVVRREAGLLQ